MACRRVEDVERLTAGNALPTSYVPLAAAAEESLLDVADLSITYDRRRRFPPSSRQPLVIVRDVAFDLRARETFSLVGESGSGKSTIARTVGGLLRPLTGQLTFEGRDLAGTVESRSKEVRRQIQLVLQNPDASLNPRQRVHQIVGRPLELFFGLHGKARRAGVEKALEDVRLDTAFASRYPDELSGGERQRVAIARALAAKPQLMLCDEILSALDVSVQTNIVELLRELQAEQGIAYLFISHDLAVVRSLSHRVGVLYLGELCEVGTAQEVYAPPYHPYTHMLLSAVPEIDGENEVSSAVRSDPGVASSRPASACPFADRCPWKVGPVCDEVAPPWQATTTCSPSWLAARSWRAEPTRTANSAHVSAPGAQRAKGPRPCSLDANCSRHSSHFSPSASPGWISHRSHSCRISRSPTAGAMICAVSMARGSTLA